MMLSRTGWGETSLAVAFQTVEGRRAPWGCAAGAPYRGTASPPPPPQSSGTCGLHHVYCVGDVCLLKLQTVSKLRVLRWCVANTFEPCEIGREKCLLIVCFCLLDSRGGVW